jgi:hypothetical protein
MGRKIFVEDMERWLVVREALPQRRRSESFNLNWGGFKQDYAITIGYYDDGRIGEVFITGAKSGTPVESIARDSAVVLSIALQYGVDLETVSKAITRDAQGSPQTIVGVVIDKLLGEKHDEPKQEL